MTNTERADAALIALDRYSIDKDGPGRHPVEMPEIGEAMIDLITDLKHLARREGVDFDAVLRMAGRNYFKEARA